MTDSLQKEYRLTDDNYIVRTIDEAIIPFDDQNIDYLKYLEWLDAGNTPGPPIVPSSVNTTLSIPDQLKLLGIDVSEFKRFLGL
jgi:hypothetical protein